MGAGALSIGFLSIAATVLTAFGVFCGARDPCEGREASGSSCYGGAKTSASGGRTLASVLLSAGRNLQREVEMMRINNKLKLRLPNAEFRPPAAAEARPFFLVRMSSRY